MTVLKLALADDQALFRRGLRALLDTCPDFQVAIETSDGHCLLSALLEQSVDVVLSDIRMPRVSGIDVVRRMRQGGNRQPVILLTTFDDMSLLSEAVDAGANGYLLKDAEPEELINAIKRVANGERLLMPQCVTAVRSHDDLPDPEHPLPALSEREQAVLRLMAAGLSNRDISGRLHLAEGTIKNRVSVILGKLNARDRTQAVLKSIKCGLI